MACICIPRMAADSFIRLLCTGDLHLGRYPTRLSARRDELSVASVWDAVVAYATDQAVDAVVLTGDVVDRDNRYFEAFGPLQRGLRRLADAGVDTFAVSGNHDFDVLPQLADVLHTDQFRLLGKGGRWEPATLTRDGEEVLRLVGWSFAEQHVTTSPLDHLDLPPSDLPTVGIVHGDLDHPASRYAPLERTRLRAFPVRAWLLGHVHKPVCHEEPDPLILYPGSLQPLDPGEEGNHGPWLVEVDPDGTATARQLPMASLCYASLEVDVSDAASDAALRQATVRAIEDDVEQRVQQCERLRHVVYRLCCTGRTSLHRRVQSYGDVIVDELEVSFENTTAVVDDVVVETRPDVDLHALARSSDPPGALARLLLDLEQDELDEVEADLLRDVERALERIHRANAYAPLRRDAATREPPGPSDVRTMLLRRGMLLLDALLAQNEGEVPS